VARTLRAGPSKLVYPCPHAWWSRKSEPNARDPLFRRSFRLSCWPALVQLTRHHRHPRVTAADPLAAARSGKDLERRILLVGHGAGQWQ
jgi:hypothetical protein